MIKYMIALMLPAFAFAERFEIYSHAEDSYTDYVNVVDNKTHRHYLYVIPSADLYYDDFDGVDIADIIFHFKPYVSYSDGVEVDYECSP